MEFTFSSKAKTFTLVLIVLGGILVGVDLGINGLGDGARLWSNIYVNGFFFFAIALGALFFLALQYATEAAWATLLKRIFEGIMSYLPIGMAVILLVLVLGQLHVHHMFHWMDGDLYQPFAQLSGDAAEQVKDGAVLSNEAIDLLIADGNATLLGSLPETVDVYTMANEGIVKSPRFDKIIAGKAPYIGSGSDSWFFWLRTGVYMLTFLIYMRTFRKRSLLEDKEGGVGTHFKNYKKGALFLVFFAVFSSTLAWDWIMSIDTHWFSTLFGWYVFSGMWVTCMITAILLVLYLKGKGYLPQVNENHLHDLGKWMFAISILWSYLWFSQFMLIWYSNIPEEVTYFQERFNLYQVPFISMFFVNLLFPLIILMSRDAKRNSKYLLVIGLIILGGHWIDVFLLIMPGTVHGDWQLGFMELGFFLLFGGVFMFTVLRQLTKAPLTPVHHPYMEESIHHHI